MAEFPTLKSSWPWPWIGSYCIPSCISHRPLPTCQISFKSKKLFVDKRQTYKRTDRHLKILPKKWGHATRVHVQTIAHCQQQPANQTGGWFAAASLHWQCCYSVADSYSLCMQATATTFTASIIIIITQAHLKVTRQRAKCREVCAVFENISRSGLLHISKELELVLLRLRHEVSTRCARSRTSGAWRAGAWAGTRHTQPVCPLWTQNAVHWSRRASIHRWHHWWCCDISTGRRTNRHQTVSLALFTLLTIVILLSYARLVTQVLSQNIHHQHCYN